MIQENSLAGSWNMLPGPCTGTLNLGGLWGAFAAVLPAGYGHTQSWASQLGLWVGEKRASSSSKQLTSVS